jgi:hypothetical protein
MRQGLDPLRTEAPKRVVPCGLAELMGATNPSGWSGVLKVKTPAGATAGYILLYSNP